MPKGSWFCPACDQGDEAEAAAAKAAEAEAEGGVDAAASSGVITHAEGFSLYLSKQNAASGYMGVRPLSKTPTVGTRYKAYAHDDDRRQIVLGIFSTAVEAAVAYAKFQAQCGSGVIDASADRGEDEGMAEEGGVEEEEEREEEDGVQLEAEGFKLHLSAQSNTGYKGVYWKSARPVGSQYEVQGLLCRGKKPYLGTAATAVEAAIIFAKHVAERKAQMPTEVEAQSAARRRDAAEEQEGQPAAKKRKASATTPTATLTATSTAASSSSSAPPLVAPPPAALPPLPVPAALTAGPPVGGARVRAELDRLGLALYAETLIDEYGYDDLDFLVQRSVARRMEIGKECGMKPGHAEKFSENLRS